MRLGRLAFILLAIYLVFIGGSAYYSLIFQVRVLHHLLITILLGLWLVMRVRRAGLPKTPLDKPIAAALAVWFISAVTSIDSRMAFEHLWFPISHVILFYVLADMFQRGRQRLVMETQFMLGAAVVLLSSVELLSWYFGLGFLPGTQTGWINVIGEGALLPLKLPRLSLAMNISTLLAGYVAPLVTLSAAWALTARREYRRVLWALAGALLIIVILTFSRGGLLSILTAVGTAGVFRLLQMPRVTQRLPARAVAGAALFTGAAIIAGFVILSLTQARVGNMGDAGRLDMWRSALAMTGDYPLTGVGPGIYGRAFRSYRDPTIVQDKLASAHNAYLNTAAETGILGIAVSVWLGITFLRAWFANWKRTDSPPRRLRLEAALGALLGLGIHSLADVFTITPIVLVMVLLAAYSVTPTDMVYEGRREQPQRDLYRMAGAGVLLALVIGYGVWLLRLDQAQARYLNSFNQPSTALSEAQAASELDPRLNLYRLHIAYLNGDNDTAINQALPDYQAALKLEPTWDTGWINLAALTWRTGNADKALEYLERARQINRHNTASLHWARLAEQTGTASQTDIINAYINALKAPAAPLPLAAFWWETPARQAALEQYLAEAPADIRYRVLAVHTPERATQLVSPAPQSAAEWWVAGEFALTVERNIEKAEEAFGEAIRLEPDNGDYYVSRARATLHIDPEAAKRDLDIAELLGTIAEYPNAVRAEMATSAAEAERLRANALPPRQVVQEFAGVLYGRPAIFDVIPDIRVIGPGRAAMQPWYTIAEQRLAGGNIEGALNVYRAILDYAPDEQEARETLAVYQE